MLIERKKNDRPVTTDRVKMFDNDPTLRKVSLFSNPHFQHAVVPMNRPKTCALCTAGREAQRKVKTCCNKCEVTLCMLPRPPSNTSCCDAWHSIPDLKAEARNRSYVLVAERRSEKESNRAKHRSRMATAGVRRRRSKDEAMADASAVSPVAAGNNDVATTSNMLNGDDAADVYNNNVDGGGDNSGDTMTINAAAAAVGNILADESNATAGGNNATTAGASANVVAETIVADSGNDASGMVSLNNALGALHVAGDSETRSPLMKRILRDVLFPSTRR